MDGIFGAIVIIVLYFIPTIVSGMRGCRAHVQIVLVNIFFGWTAIGWIVALIWANSPNVEAQ